MLAVSLADIGSQVAMASPDEGPTADTQPGATSSATPAPATPIALLGVFADGKPDKGLREAVSDRLSRLGEEVTAVSDFNDLSACKQTACYAEISAKSGAARVLRIDIYESAARRYYVEGALYERGQSSPRSNSASCDDCATENLRVLVGDLAARLLTAPEKPATRTTAAPQKPQPVIALLPPAPVAPQPRPRRFTPGRIALVTLLSAGTAAALISTIVVGTTPFKGNEDRSFCALDKSGPPANSNDLPCVTQTALTTTGALFTALFGAGLTVSLTQFLGREAAY